MFIHNTLCISPQHTFHEINPNGINIEDIVASVENKLYAIEPKYENIPLNTLRRMGKAVRMGVGAAIKIINNHPPLDGIIIGTANGGMEDCIKFLNQVIDYDEGKLTPINFVQSTANAIAAQIALSVVNNGYNITHVHRGLAFENALLDAMMLLNENTEAAYLLGGGDEISTFNFNIEKLGGSYKKEIISSKDLYNTDSVGSIAGEGISMFIVNNKQEGAIAKVKALRSLHTSDVDEVTEQLKYFLIDNLPSGQQPDLFLTGENGDSRLNHFYSACEAMFNHITIARFKHLCGEYPTSSSFALWLSCYLLNAQQFPLHILKTSLCKKPVNTILIYNNFKGVQHGFILVEK
ncbi:MAG: beta-ketoacyl synthase chain length factor [Bacteroidota bacterium]